MGNKAKNVVEPSCKESTITIITTDRYFFLAIKHLIHSMLPDILSDKGVLYNVVHCESVFHLNYQDGLQSEDRLLITDYDVRLIGNSHVLKLMQGMNIFRSIMLVIHKELPLAGVDCFLSKSAAVIEIKHKLREFILRPPALKNIDNSQLLSRFTSREHQIIRMILRGKRVETIAKTLKVSPKTVYAHRSRIYQKVGVRNIQGLFQHEGLLTSKIESSRA